MLVVRKYGGSCLKNKQDILKVAHNIVHGYKQNERPVVIVSALQGMTDQLYQLAEDVSRPCLVSSDFKREYDLLVTTGEQVSACLLAIGIKKLRIKARVYTAWQLGMFVDHDKSNICSIDRIEALKNDINNGVIPIITGFQAVNRQGDIVTLGRNSSDLTAVVIANFLYANECRIFKDTAGIFTGDPKKSRQARLYKELILDEALQLAKRGDKVIHLPALEYLQRNFVPTRVLPVDERSSGTEIIRDSDSQLKYTTA